MPAILQKIGSNRSPALVQALKTIPTLTTLDLHGNSVGDNRGQALTEALNTNLSLATLNLQSNLICYKRFLAFSMPLIPTQLWLV